ncbi:MAG: hypothetical protein ACE5FQ_07930 [Thiogranum sp.]
MPFEFEEPDYRQTPLGDISPRRRPEPRPDGESLYGDDAGYQPAPPGPVFYQTLIFQ